MKVSKYQGFTHKELDSRFRYDPINGRFWNKKTGKLLDSTKGGRVYLGIRICNDIVSLQPSRVALILANKYFLEDDEIIKFLDKDNLNLSLSNLLVVKKKQKALDARYVDHPKAYPTYQVGPDGEAVEVDGVFKIVSMSQVGIDKGVTNYFVARRGPKQAVFRTHVFEEAVNIRKEWEKDNTIHRWDKTFPLSYQ